LYSPEINGKIEAKKNNLILIPDENDFKIRNENDSFSQQNGKTNNNNINTTNKNQDNNNNNLVEKTEIAFTNEYLKKELKLKIVQKTYDTELVEWFFNVISKLS